jgi:hypothetical protein
MSSCAGICLGGHANPNSAMNNFRIAKGGHVHTAHRHVIGEPDEIDPGEHLRRLSATITIIRSCRNTPSNTVSVIISHHYRRLMRSIIKFLNCEVWLAIFSVRNIARDRIINHGIMGLPPASARYIPRHTRCEMHLRNGSNIWGFSAILTAVRHTH